MDELYVRQQGYVQANNCTTTPANMLQYQRRRVTTQC